MGFQLIVEIIDKKILNLRIERITKATDDITFSYSEDFDDINLSKTQLPKFFEIEENTIIIHLASS